MALKDSNQENIGDYDDEKELIEETSEREIAHREDKPDARATPVDTGKIKFGPYSWFILAIIAAIRVCFVWQRSIFSYSYGYQGVGDQFKNKVYEIATEYPQLSKHYGFLTGIAYTIPFSVLGLFYGKATPYVNRKAMLSLFMSFCGIVSILVSRLDSFNFLALSRVLLGCICAFFNPLSFSLLSEYFPDDKRSTANSILQSANYVGWGLSSLSVLLIRSWGWRKTFGFLGMMSFLLSGLSALLIKEPKKQESTQKSVDRGSSGDGGDAKAQIKKEDKPTFAKLFANPVNRLVLLGAFLRNCAGSVNTYYVPVFFLRNYPAQKAIFSTCNAFSLSILGMVSGILAGVISDKLEKKRNYMVKGWICFSGCAVALPLMALATLQTSNFWLSMISHVLLTFCIANFGGLAITMMQLSSEKLIQPLVVSSYFFAATLGQTTGPWIMSILTNYFNVVANPTLYGPLITAMTALGFAGTCPIWYLAAKEYKKIMEERERAQAAETQ